MARQREKLKKELRSNGIMHHEEEKEESLSEWYKNSIPTTIMLSPTDFAILLTSIENPPEPNQKLIDLMRKK